jgi:hypothetical protein
MAKGQKDLSVLKTQIRNSPEAAANYGYTITDDQATQLKNLSDAELDAAIASHEASSDKDATLREAGLW